MNAATQTIIRTAVRFAAGCTACLAFVYVANLPSVILPM
jgi:hypothetical protein